MYITAFNAQPQSWKYSIDFYPTMQEETCWFNTSSRNEMQTGSGKFVLPKRQNFSDKY
jgi:hypothetical protein